MSEVKFTPGPWKYAALHAVDISDGKATPILDGPLTNFIVKRTYRDEQGRRCTSFIAEANSVLLEVSANARLIAAAPELYEALVQARTFIEEELETRQASFLPDPTDAESTYLSDAGQALTVAKAALAKAEGR